MWVSDRINWIISKRAKPIFFQNYIKSKHLSWRIKWRKIWLWCRPFEHDGLSSEGWPITLQNIAKRIGIFSLLTNIFRKFWNLNETQVRVKPYWPEKTFIVFMFSQTFDWRHQNIIISKEIVQNEFWKTITETSVLSWIQNNNLYRNIQLKKVMYVFHQNIAS